MNAIVSAEDQNLINEGERLIDDLDAMSHCTFNEVLLMCAAHERNGVTGLAVRMLSALPQAGGMMRAALSVRITTGSYMTKDAREGRRKELEAIRIGPGGGQRIAVIFDKDIMRDDKEMLVPSSFVQAMINQILRREFPGDVN